MEETNRRLAIVRCDSHAYWYAPFLAEVDPLVLMSYSTDAPTRQSIHSYACDVGNYRKLAIQPVPGFVVSKVFDRVGDRDAENQDPELLQYGIYPGRAVAFSETFVSKPEVCHSIEETVSDIDGAFIADSSSPKDGADHLALAKPFLERGIPLFVDKPFAATLADALEMVRLAQVNKTPLMNASLLSYTAVGDFFRRRFDEIGQPGFLTVKGVGYTNGAVGHGLALALAMFGFGVESVECMGATPDPSIGHWNRASRDYRLEHILLHYPDGRQALVMNTDHRWYPQTSEFYCSVYSRQGALHSPGIGDREFLTGGAAIINLFKQMIDTKQPPIPYSHILEPFAIIEAARKAQKERRRVTLSEVWDARANGEGD